MYANGSGVRRDDREAEIWYRKAAEQKNVRAQSDLGWFLHEGRGRKRDDKEAAEWMRKAAEQNEPFAQNNLGLMYAQGCGVPQDDAQAVAWYRKASEQNLAMAQTNLGTMYLEGKGVPRDDVEATKWFEKAAAQANERGSEEAKNNLAVIEQVHRLIDRRTIFVKVLIGATVFGVALVLKVGWDWVGVGMRAGSGEGA
jgi:TPR repeat protein